MGFSTFKPIFRVSGVSMEYPSVVSELSHMLLSVLPDFTTAAERLAHFIGTFTYEVTLTLGGSLSVACSISNPAILRMM